MKKTVLNFLFVSAMVVGATSCGSETATTDASEDAHSEEATHGDEAPEEVVIEEVIVEEAPAVVDVDLSEYGIPVILAAPGGATVKSELTEQGRVDFDMEQYSVTKGNYCMSVAVDNENEDGETVASIVSDARADLFEDEQVVEELDNGFITVDEYGSHNFLWVTEKDGKFLEFSVGLTMNDLSKQDVYDMLNSIKL